MNLYLLLKLVHVFAVVIFLGNIITGLSWMNKANKTNNRSIIGYTMKGIIDSDKLFTIPGVIIITLGGISAAIQGGTPILRTGWIFWPIVLFTLSGLAFSWQVAPLQRKIFRLANVSDDAHFNTALYHSYFKKWETWGLIALATPLAAMAMMVFKGPLRSVF